MGSEMLNSQGGSRISKTAGMVIIPDVIAWTLITETVTWHAD